MMRVMENVRVYVSRSAGGKTDTDSEYMECITNKVSLLQCWCMYVLSVSIAS